MSFETEMIRHSLNVDRINTISRESNTQGSTDHIEAIEQECRLHLLNMRLEATQSRRATGWILPSERLPPVPEGGSHTVLVTVQRTNGKRYSFPAVYCNRFELTWNDGGVAGEGPGYEVTVDEEGEIQLASGWFTVTEHDDEDDWYEALLDAGDTLIAWQPIPAPLEPEPAA